MDVDLYQQKIIDEAREFAKSELMPRAAEFDENGELPRDIIERLVEKKFLSPTLPQKYGGLELNPIYYGRFIEEIGKACCATRMLITLQTSVIGDPLLRWGTEPQKEKWLKGISFGKKVGAFALTEPDIGSDARSVQCNYFKRGDAYIINGKKKWISFGSIADFYLVIAQSDGKITAFIVERESKGINIKPIKGLMAGRAAHIAEIEFNEVSVPQKNVLGSEGAGFSYIVNSSLDSGRYSVAWAGVGIAQAALEAMVFYARSRTQFGKKIYNYQLIQGLIGDAVTQIHSARALCLKAGQMRESKDPDAITETIIAKYFASRVAMRVTTDAVQIHGADGFYSQYPVERLFREAKVLEIIEGTNQIHQEFIAKYGLRKYYERAIN